MTTTISGSNGIVFPDATSMQTGQQAVKAWVNFNGTGVVAIRAGYNVVSITDNGTGDYTVNFTTAMVDANYGVGGITTGFDLTNTARTAVIAGAVATGAALKSTTQLRMQTGATGGSVLTDMADITVFIFR